LSSALYTCLVISVEGKSTPTRILLEAATGGLRVGRARDRYKRPYVKIAASEHISSSLTTFSVHTLMLMTTKSTRASSSSTTFTQAALVEVMGARHFYCNADLK